MRTQPCITVQKTQQGDLNKNPDINLTAGVIRTSTGHRGPAGVLQKHRIQGQSVSRCRGSLRAAFLSGSDS
jgi:hypothetical protein